MGFPALFAQLVADAYDGWASLETHYRKAAAIPEEPSIAHTARPSSEGWRGGLHRMHGGVEWDHAGAGALAMKFATCNKRCSRAGPGAIRVPPCGQRGMTG